MIIKYCNKNHNLELNLLANIRLGTVMGYSNEKEGSGIHDSEEGLLHYFSEHPIEVTPQLSKSYFNNFFLSDSNGDIKIQPGLGGDASFEFPLTNDRGDDGYLKIHPTKEQPLTIKFNNRFLIYSLTFDENPSLEKARKFSEDYNSYYEIIDIHNFSTKIGNELSLKFGCPIYFKYEKVNYKSEKYLQIDGGDFDCSIDFSDRALKSIFNKNTKHDHEDQNEIRIVFSFADQGKAQSIFQTQKYIDLRPWFIRKSLGSHRYWPDESKI